MAHPERVHELNLPWCGPYSWPDFESTNGLPALPGFQGVYLWTAEYESGYLIYCAGITGRPFRKRFDEHTNCYLAGDYTVLDIAALQQGQRCEVWHGWSYARNHRDQLAQRRSEIIAAAKLQMAGFRVFVAHVEDRRIRERIEAAIMHCLHVAPPPLCDVPDLGMMLSPRHPSEPPITVCNVCSSELCGLPGKMLI